MTHDDDDGAADEDTEDTDGGCASVRFGGAPVGTNPSHLARLRHLTAPTTSGTTPVVGIARGACCRSCQAVNHCSQSLTASTMQYAAGR